MPTRIWNWRLLRAGSFRLDGGTMFGIIPKALWVRLTPPDDLNRIQLQTNCLLLDDGKQKILIETGYGNKFDEKGREMFDLEPRWIGQALEEHGVDRMEIDAVVVTHLHFDHAGGLTWSEAPGAPPQPSFPNARVFVQRQEWEDALNNKSTMTRTYLRENLDPVAGQLELLDGECEALPGIAVLPTRGHTWGQQGVVFHDDAGPILFPGDMMPTASHAGLAYNMAYDVLPYDNLLTKRSLLARCAREGWRIAIDHEPGDPIVRVLPHPTRPDQFQLSPAAPSAGGT